MISIVVAISKNNIIGKNNDLPWHYSEDLKYFKELTTNNTIVMGSRTFQSILRRINKPLPNRKNIVVTRNPNFTYPNVEVVNDLEKFLSQKFDEEIFVIGGKDIFDVALNYADRLYITHINKEYSGDVSFSDIDYSRYQLVSKKDSGVLSFCVYERKKI